MRIILNSDWKDISDLKQKLCHAVIVTNNLKETNAFGGRSHIFLADMVFENNGVYNAYLWNSHGQLVENITHFLPFEF